MSEKVHLGFKAIKLKDLQAIVNSLGGRKNHSEQKGLWRDESGYVFKQKKRVWICLGILREGEFQPFPYLFNVSELNLLAEALAAGNQNTETPLGWKEIRF